MFEPAKNSKAPDCSEALILLGRDGEITYGHLVVGWPQRKAISAARKTGFFVRAAFQPLVDFSSNKKSPRLRLRLFCWSGWRDSNSRPLAPHTGIFHFVIFRYFHYLIEYQHFTKVIFGFLCIL
jgi:hypothetical protein